MKHNPILIILTSLMLVLSISGCDVLPFVATMTPTPTHTETPTPIPPSPTPAPPTDTPTITPTETSGVPSETLTTAPQFPTFTPTFTKAPTKGPVTPLAKAKFQGTFTGGTLVFRTGANGLSVVPKTVSLKGATCKEGKTVSETIGFEPPTFFWVVDGKFTIVWGTEVTITGVFITPTRATGTISLALKTSKGKCTIGPLSWIADYVAE